jgi:hypothetical protein
MYVRTHDVMLHKIMERICSRNARRSHNMYVRTHDVMLHKIMERICGRNAHGRADAADASRMVWYG